MGQCVKCGRETTFHYKYYSARVANRASNVTEGFFSTKTRTETIYTDIKPQIGYLCSGEGCWKGDKPSVLKAITSHIGMSLFALFLSFLGIYLFIYLLTAPLKTGVERGIGHILGGLTILLIFLIPAMLIFRMVLRTVSGFGDMPPNDEVGAAYVCNILGRKGINGVALLTPGEVKALSPLR